MQNRPPIQSRAPSQLKRVLTTNNSKLNSSSNSLVSPPLSGKLNVPNAPTLLNSPPKDKIRRPSTVNGKAKDAEGNINVVVRCRGRSPYEIRDNSVLVASAVGTRGTTVTLTNPSSTITTSSSSSLIATVQIPATKTYNFGERIEDGKKPMGNVFGPDADQGMVYNDVAKPILSQVLQGYNCTIFAYGQTGTGKTYTMEGDTTPYHGTFSPNAGIIPRTLYSLFEKLAEDRSEFSVRCSFIELYNEELRDLNASEFIEPQGTQPMDPKATLPGVAQAAATGGLRIYDDKHTGVIIQGLEETLIRSAEEGIKVLKKGSDRRQIAATKCNEQSSRSHSIFTVTVHIKEAGRAGGEDLLKVGKLNLVDLAGSENIGRSGAEKERAKEAGKINASLLALGRVINKLVEKQSHIPYRESKLTRLLQDSLGGRTKTTIIATISPVNFEETISTLDYALRAKSIQNRPEVNQRVTKHALLGQYATEIERLKSDLLAARERNGIFFSKESWAELQSEQDSRRLQLEEVKRQVEINDSQLQTTRSQFEQNLRLLGAREEELKQITGEVDKQSKELIKLAEELMDTMGELEGETVLREAFELSRSGWKGAAGDAFSDVAGLREKLARKTDVETSNASVVTDAGRVVDSMTAELGTQLGTFKGNHDEFADDVRSRMREFAEREAQGLATNYDLIDTRLSQLALSAQAITSTAHSIGSSGHSFDQFVKNTRDELLEAVIHLAERSQEAQMQQGDAIMLELKTHAEKSRAAIANIVEPMRLMYEESVASLQKDAEQLRLVQEEDQSALASENARLKETVLLLAASIESQRCATMDEDAHLLALLTERLKARSTSHLGALDEVHTLVQTSLEQTGEAQEKSHAARRVRLDELERSNGSCKIGIEARMVEGEQSAVVGRETLAASLMKVGEDLDTSRATVRTYSNENAQLVSKSAVILEEAGAVFRTDASTSHAIFDATFEKMVEDTRESYVVMQKEVRSIEEDVDMTARGVADSIDSNHLATTAFVTTSTSHLTSLRASMKSSLETNIRVDISTGMTPRKRDWPKDSMALVDLDGERVEVMKMLVGAKKELLGSTPESRRKEKNSHLNVEDGSLAGLLTVRQGESDPMLKRSVSRGAK